MQPPTVPVQGGIEAALAALLVLRPGELSRNRHFRLHATREGTRAWARAAALRGLVRHLTGAHGPARTLTVDEHGEASTVGYALPRVAARRLVQVSATELSILRVALAEAGLRLLPAALMLRAEDRARVDDLIAQARRLRGEPR